MLKHLVAVGLVMCSGAAFATDCSRMSPAELRMVEDPKKACAPKQGAKKPKKPEREVAWEAAKVFISKRYKNPEAVLFRNVKSTFEGTIICGEVYTDAGYQIFLYMGGANQNVTVAGEPMFSATNFARACLGYLQLFELKP